MAKQDNEEEGGGGGIMSNLKQVGGGFVKAANLAQRVSGGVIKANPIIMTAGTGAALYSGYRRHKDSEAGVPKEDQYPQYNPYGYETAALRKGFDAVSHIVSKVTGREGSKEPSEFPQETAQLEAVTEQTEGPSTPTESDTESSDRAVNYSLTDEGSEAGMLQPMDEGVGRTAGAQNPNFQSAAEELNYIKEHGFEGSAQEKADYISQLLRKQRQERKDAKDSGDQASAGGSTRTTASRQGYDAKNNRGITGALELSAIPQDRAQEIQNGRITLRGKAYNIVGNTGDKFLVPDPDQPDYSRRV